MEVKICTGKACSSRYSKYISARLENDKKFHDMKKLTISECACMWQCKKWPNIKIKNQVHNYMNPANASGITKKEYK